MTETEKKGANAAKKCVFAVINIANNRNEQRSVAEYAANLAKHLGLEVVLYVKNDETKFSFEKAYVSVLKLAEDISKISSVRVSTQQKSKFSFFSDIPAIAAEEHASYIIMQIDESAKFWSESMWKTTQRSVIPTILLPKNFIFVPFKSIAIAVDSERKVQKLNVVIKLAKKFDSTIKVFVENTIEEEKKPFINIIYNQICKNLNGSNIKYETEPTRKTTKFLTRLCKFSAKHTDLLVIEVEPGKIESDIKKNLSILLQILAIEVEPGKIESDVKNNSQEKAQAKPIPVLLAKTKQYGTVITNI